MPIKIFLTADCEMASVIRRHSSAGRVPVPDYVGPLCEQTSVSEDICTVIPSMLWNVFPHGKFGAWQPTFRQNVKIEKGVLDYVDELYDSCSKPEKAVSRWHLAPALQALPRGTGKLLDVA